MHLHLICIHTLSMESDIFGKFTEATTKGAKCSAIMLTVKEGVYEGGSTRVC